MGIESNDDRSTEERYPHELFQQLPPLQERKSSTENFHRSRLQKPSYKTERKEKNIKMNTTNQDAHNWSNFDAIVAPTRALRGVI